MEEAAEMLEEMIKSTHQLDEILQCMCAAECKGPRDDTVIREDDIEFEDCVDHATTEVTAEEYFETIRKVFGALSGGKLEIAPSVVDSRKLLNGASGDLAVRFASCTRETSLVFPTVMMTSGNFGVGGVSTELPADYNLSYSYFLSRLRQQILGCDHIVPVERANTAAQLAFLLLEEQQRRLLGAISNKFPYNRESIYWVQRNRLCEIFVKETEHDGQWGLLLQLNVKSHLRAQVDKHTEDSSQQDSRDRPIQTDSGLSTCTICMVFLPKICYVGSPEKETAFQTSIAIELSLYDSEKQKVSGEEQNGLKDQVHATSSKHLSPELSEMVSVSIWGTHDEIPVLENQHNKHHKRKLDSFRKVNIETPFPRNRVVQAACSRFHTLFLNDMGLVFAYGHTLDGALGLGNETSGYVAQPTLVDYFFDNLIVVQDISCGGDQLVGAHSAAVSQEGNLFTWGVGIALGRGTMRSASTPQRIDLPPLKTNEGTVASTMPLTAIASSVSCGSGFCVALTHDGHAFSWGKWSDGRLGLGRIPIIARTSRRHSGGPVRKQFQSFQLTPKQIQHVYSIEANPAYGGVTEEALLSKVSCGDAHCVGLTKTGELVTWGRGNNGQQGRGDARDTLVPTGVLRNVSERKLWRDVAAGQNWSMALSSDGQVWSWGACGGAVLGHGLHGSQKNALLAETILQRHQRLISQRNMSSSYSCPRVPSLKWMTPQMIPCFATPDIRICRISAGAQHAAAISDTGDLYMWGEGYTETHTEASDSDGLLLSSLPKLLNSGQREENNNQDNAGIGIRSVDHVVCGGRQTIVFTSGSFLARSMTKLYRDSIAHVKLGGPDKNTDLAGTDLVLVVSGHRLLAHKLLLAQRSPVLRELILDEEQQERIRFTADEENDLNYTIPSTEPMELLLPRLRVDVARALVEFIYTDNFTMELNNSSYYLVNDVLRAAKIYKLPSLVQLCHERLFSTSPSSLFEDEAPSPLLHEIDEESSDTNTEEDEEIGVNNSEATRTLNDDMKFALNDEVWADTVLLTEGRRIPVHRCMLIARSEYFRAVFAFHRSAAPNEPPDSKMLVLKVEDSYAGIVRVLRFIYYDQVALPQLKRNGDKRDDNTMENDVGGEIQHDSEDASDQLLEDLVAADKYGLERMKRLCEHAICVTVANCLEVLAVAELVHTTHLKQVAMTFVQTHLPDVTARHEEFHRFQEDFPLLLEELYASLRDASRDEFLLREWHTEVGTCLAAQREEQELEWGKKSTTLSFPWVPLSLTVAFGAMYLSVMNAEEHEFSAIPATNVAAITAIGGAILMGYL